MEFLYKNWKGYKPCHRRLSSCFFMLVMQIMRFNFQGLSRAKRSQSLISTFLESESLKAYFLHKNEFTFIWSKKNVWAWVLVSLRTNIFIQIYPCKTEHSHNSEVKTFRIVAANILKVRLLKIRLDTLWEVLILPQEYNTSTHSSFEINRVNSTFQIIYKVDILKYLVFYHLML